MALIKSGVIEEAGLLTVWLAFGGRPSLLRLEKSGFRLVFRSTIERLRGICC